MLWPVNFSLAYVGYEVLDPFIAYGVEAGLRYSDAATVETRLRGIVSDFRAELQRIAERPTIPFNRMAEWGADGRIRARGAGPLGIHQEEEAAGAGVRHGGE